MDYSNDIKINENGLDVEWLNQPRLAMKYGQNLANSERNLASAEEAFELLKAELRAEVNLDVEGCLGEKVKPTNDNILSFMLNQESYQEALEQINDLKYEAKVAKVAYDQISNARKTALENLVKLVGMNYFSAPNVPRDLGYEAIQVENQKQADSKVKIKRKRKE